MTAYVGEIRLFAGNFAPAGWMFCAGQTLPISENDVLFQLIGTTYGGDGEETFVLPDLRSRVPVHMGTGGTYQLGEIGGAEVVTLNTQQIPSHTHTMMATNNLATTATPSPLVVPAVTQGSVITAYGVDAPSQTLSAQTLTPQGGSQPHDNMQPSLALNFIISMFGVFPSQT
jgi:microcystin-dependent protein